jgi:type II secretory pathway component PulF
MDQERPKRSVAVTTVLLAVSVALWAGLGAVLVVVVPRYERDFRDRGLRLPAVTQAVVGAGRWADTYWYVLPLFGLLVLPVVVVVSWLLRHRVSGALPGWLWLGALLGVPLVLHLGVWVGLLLP